MSRGAKTLAALLALSMAASVAGIVYIIERGVPPAEPTELTLALDDLNEALWEAHEALRSLGDALERAHTRPSDPGE